MVSRPTKKQTAWAVCFWPAFVLFCTGMAIAWSPAAAALPNQASPLGMQVGVMILTPIEGVDFTSYTARLEATLKRNWYAVMPESALMGQKGIVTVLFHIQQDGTILAEDPTIERLSGKEPLDEAPVKAILNSAPFEHLPTTFHGSNIKLRVAFLYNIILSRRTNPARLIPILRPCC